MFNPQLNVPALQQAYAGNGAISIQNILLPEIATAVNRELEALDWVIEIKDNSQRPGLRIPGTRLSGRQTVLDALDMAPHDLDLDDLFYARKCVNSENFTGARLKDITKAINSDTFLDTMRQITGHTSVTHAWVEATCYEKCCFLGSHRDDHHPDNKVAFVLNFTQNWKLDWGGLLMVQFNENQPPTIVPPLWNSLSMFTVPVDHTVSCVSPAATGKRYSLTGWLR